MVSFKVVAVGNSYVGKTCLLRTYAEGTFPENEVQNESDGYKAKIGLSNRTINLVLYAVNCEENYSRLRHFLYPLTDAFLICFSLVDHKSLEDAEHIWYPEVTQHCPNIPVILVGTKGDLVDTKSEQHAHCKARALKKRLNLKQYVETSAMKNEGLHNVFQEVVQAVLRIPTKQKPICKSDKNVDSNKKCVIM